MKCYRNINILIQIVPAFSDWMSHIQGCCKTVKLYLKYTKLKYIFKRLYTKIFCHHLFSFVIPNLDDFLYSPEHKRRYSE